MAAFAQAELEGWNRNAADYEALVLPATRQAFDPIIESLGILNDIKVLEMASGTGHLAQRLSDRGAKVVAIDFAPEMIRGARPRFPAVNFIEVDCERVPFENETFDAVVSCFGALHFERPDKVFGEAYRVLKPGGRFVFTIWLPPEEGGDFLGLILGVYQRTADMSVSIPAGPPMFELANVAATCKRLAQLGFDDCEARDFTIRWSTQGVEGVQHIVERGLVRTRMILDLQTPERRERVIEELRAQARQHIRDGRFEMKNTARLFMTRKLKPQAIA
jgi:ubiquinone/menaquinone biosynthesis C-methylase UbiE